MVKKQTEKSTQTEAIKHANQKGIKTIRMYFGPGIQTGWPDVLFLLFGGRPCFIEFKSPGKEPTKKQWRKINELRDVGYNAWWADDLETAKRMIDLAIEGEDIKDA